jgi:hypothetical protein
MDRFKLVHLFLAIILILFCGAPNSNSTSLKGLSTLLVVTALTLAALPLTGCVAKRWQKGKSP